MQPVIPRIPAPYNKFPGKIVAFTRNQVLWRFGWKQGTALAVVHKTYTKNFLYVRTLLDGRVLETIQSKHGKFDNYLMIEAKTVSDSMLYVWLANPTDDDKKEVEILKKELVSQITGILNFQQHTLKAKLITLLNYRAWILDVPPSGLELLWKAKSR